MTISNSERLHLSAAFVEETGNLRLSDGRSLREAFTLNGVSLWDASSVDLALHLLPPIIHNPLGPSTANRVGQIARLLRAVPPSGKRIARWLFCDRVSEPVRGERWLLVSHTGYMFRETLAPIQKFLEREYRSVDAVRVPGPMSVKRASLRSLGIRLNRLLSLVKQAIRVRILALRSLRQIAEPQKRSLMASSIRYTLGTFVVRWLAEILQAEELIAENIPKLVVTADGADPAARIYVSMAKQRGIPTLELQFGCYGAEAVEWKFNLSDKIAVWGEQFRTLLEGTFDVDKSRIEVLGSAKFDYLFCGKSEDVPSRRRRRKRVVLFASMYNGISAYDPNYDVDALNRVKATIVDASSKCADVDLIVKPHPLERIDWMRGRKLPEHIRVIDRNTDIRELIEDCDVFLTFGSTATFDALLQGKVVASIALPEVVWWDDLFLQNGVTVPLLNERDIVRAITDCEWLTTEFSLRRHAVDQFLSQYLYREDASASEDICKFASSLANR